MKPNTLTLSLAKDSLAKIAEVAEPGLARLVETVDKVMDRHMPERQPEQKPNAA